MVRRCHCNVNHWHTGGVDLQKASQARLNSLNKSAHRVVAAPRTPEKPQRWAFSLGGGRAGCPSATRSNTRPVAVLWLAGLPVGRWPAWCACRCRWVVPVGRVPTWWPCRCWRTLPLSRCACPVVSANPCALVIRHRPNSIVQKAILKAWHATCNPHKTCLIDSIYFEAQQVAV